MPQYELVAERQVVNTWNDAQTRIIKKVVYGKGDLIEMDEEKAEPYLRSGGLRVPGQEDDEEATPDAVLPAGAGSTPPAPEGLLTQPGDLGGEGGGDFDVETADYPALQEAAKERGIPANQSGDALREAIQEHDAE